MATRNTIAVTGDDIAKDRAAEDLYLANLDNKIVSRVASKPKKSVIRVRPYDAVTLTPNSTRTTGN